MENYKRWRTLYEGRKIINFERWRSVVDFEGYYEVSNLGRVRRIRSNSANKIIKEICFLLKPHRRKYGYLEVALCTPKTGYKYRQIHRLVMQSFRGVSSLSVNHINGIPNDNRLSNLEYVSHRENSCHSNKVTRSAKYIGVMRVNKLHPWRARIYANNKSVHLGYYDTAEEAHQARVNYMADNNIINKYETKNCK